MHARIVRSSGKSKRSEQHSATFLRHRCFVAVATQSTQGSSLGLSARFMNHTPRKSFGLALVLINGWMTIHPSRGDSFLTYSKQLEVIVLMKDKKTRFYIRVQNSVLSELKLRAKQQGVPVQDLARFCLERSLAVTSLEEIRNDLIKVAQGLIATSRSSRVDHSGSFNGTLHACMKSILFTEQYLRSLALKEPDPISVAERVSSKKLKEMNL